MKPHDTGKPRAWVFSALTALAATTALAAGKPRPMALMVFADGGRADCYANAKCPALHSLIEGKWGASAGYRCAWSLFARNNLDQPTYSYGNHSSIMCGVSATKHKVLYNSQVTQGDFKTWPPWVTRLLDAKPQLKVQAEFEDGADGRICADKRIPTHLGEGGAARLAALYAKPDAPDAALLFLGPPDHWGHDHGYYPSAPEYLAAFDRSDADFGRVLKAIEERPTFKDEDWMITFVTDHGGRGRMHGVRDGHCHTIPLIIVSRHVTAGEIVGQPRHYDLPVTLLDHFGIDASNFGLDGRVIGREAAIPTRRPHAEGLACYIPFDGPLWYGGYLAENRVPGGLTAFPDGDLQYYNKGLTDRQSPTKKSMWIDGIDEPVSVCIADSNRIFADRKNGFTLSFWMRKYVPTEGKTVIAGNRDINANGPGFALRYNYKTPRFTPGVGLEYRDAKGQPRAVGAFLQEEGRWDFYAVTRRPDGIIVFCQGRSDGKFHWIADGCGDIDLDSGLPFRLGQDGTGAYLPGAHGGFDELALWNRSLSLPELRAVFETGRAGKVLYGEKEL